MKKLFLILSALIAALTIALWASGGFHTGWSQNQIPVEMVDDITGIEYTEFEDGFRAGLEVLIAGLGLSALLAFACVFLQRKSK